jgi:hypothetical protein
MDMLEEIDLIPAKKYAPVGACIYCGNTTTSKLSDEHIVPYALNGNWILQKATCEKCAYVTGQLIEQRVLRGELRHLRAALGFQTRRPSERPTLIRIQADGRDIDVPINECPIMMHFITFPSPGILEGREPAPGINPIGNITISWGPDPKQFAAQRGIKQLSGQSTLRPAEFGRMIAKIGYSWIIARFGLKSIAENFVNPVILGSSDRIGHLIGCVSVDVPKPLTANEHVLQPVMYKGGGPSGDNSLLAVRVKLFADSSTPVYEVVIGRAASSLEELPPHFYSE